MAQERRQATPIELAALLTEAVCVPGPGEAEAVQALAQALELSPDSIAEELLYLRAFAVDFAVLMTLGDGPEKDQILGRTHDHWQRIDAEAEGSLAALEERLRDYAAVVGAVDPGQGGMAQQLGISLAARVGAAGGPAAAELMVFAARLFAALYDEVTSLLTDVDIVLLDDEA